MLVAFARTCVRGCVCVMVGMVIVVCWWCVRIHVCEGGCVMVGMVRVVCVSDVWLYVCMYVMVGMV